LFRKAKGLLCEAITDERSPNFPPIAALAHPNQYFYLQHGGFLYEHIRIWAKILKRKAVPNRSSGIDFVNLP